MISIDGLQALADALARLDLSTAQRESLEGAAQRIEAAVKASLSRLPGDDHSTPWLRTGSLRDSIVHCTDEAGALVGSNDRVEFIRSWARARSRRVPSSLHRRPRSPTRSRIALAAQ
jgi:hypothetical protein